MRSLTLVTLVVLVTTGVARAATGHDPGPPPAGYNGWLILYILPPPGGIKWTTPAAMMGSAITNRGLAEQNVKDGRAFYGHPIGHVHVEMDCAKGDEKKDIPLTGMTSDDESWVVAGDGLGILLREWPGRLDHQKGAKGQGGKDNIMKDVTARKAAAGMVGIMRIPITWAECTHLRGYFDNYIDQKAYEHFGSQFRARGFVDASGKHEGSGCGGYAMSFLDVAGLLPRPMMTEKWARKVLIGYSLISNVGGRRGYPYGSNLIAKIDGKLYTYPLKKEVPAGRGLVFPGDNTPWYTADELKDEKYAPLTLYDPELMYDYLAAEWMAAKAGKNADWKDAVDEKSLVIERKRPACPPKENLKPFIDKVHDLTKE